MRSISNKIINQKPTNAQHYNSQSKTQLQTTTQPIKKEGAKENREVK